MAKKRKRGRPPVTASEKTRREVELLIGHGFTQLETCKIIGCAPMTLRKLYRREIDTGVVRANAAVVKSLWKKAVGGNVGAAIYWTKARMRWFEERPPLELRHAGVEGAPPIHVKDLTNEQLAQLIGRLKA